MVALNTQHCVSMEASTVTLTGFAVTLASGKSNGHGKAQHCAIIDMIHFDKILGDICTGYIISAYDMSTLILELINKFDELERRENAQ